MKRREIERSLETLYELVNENSFEEAYRLSESLPLDDIDSVQDLRNIALAQEKTSHFDEMKKTYLHLINTTNVRRDLKEFITVLIRIGEFGDAKVYLKEFEKMDGAVADDFELRYAMLDAMDAGADERIKLLEEFKAEEYMEIWGKKLAELYKAAGRIDDFKQEMADLHLWFGGARILPDEEPEIDHEEKKVGGIIEENLAARMEAESDIENAISEHVGSEVSRIVEQSSDVQPVEESKEPTLDEMLSETGRTMIEQLEVEPSHPQEQLDPDAPVIESVGIPKTVSGAPIGEKEHISLEAQYLNRRGPAETVGEPVKTDDPSKAHRLEAMFAVDDDYEEGPADVSDHGIRYWTTRDIVAKIRRRDFEPPHFVLAGGEEKITLTMTKKISKELTRLGYNSAQKVMRITAERMNSIHLMDQIDRLIGRCLLVTEAAELTRESVDELMQVIHEFGDEFVVVLSGPFDEIDCFLQIYPELSEELAYKVRMVY